MYRPCLSLWVHCTDVFNFPSVGSTGETKTPDMLQVNAPTYMIFLASVHPVILKYLCLDCFDLVPSWPLQSSNPSGLATPIFSLSSLEPKSLRIVILTIILVQVLCCLYQSPKHYIEIWHERPFSLHRERQETTRLLLFLVSGATGREKDLNVKHRFLGIMHLRFSINA